MNSSVEKLLSCLGTSIDKALSRIPDDEFDRICEIRVRANKPVVLVDVSSKYFLKKKGSLSPLSDKVQSDELLISTPSEIKNSFLKLCEFSVYKRQSEINNGFITVNGGHRVGVCGTCNIVDNNIKSVTDLTSLNVRIAKEFKGCADDIFSKTQCDSGLLLCGVPSSGKTTLLRDLSRRLSLNGNTITLVDERFELSAAYNGKSHFDIGLCDVYCGYPKSIAITQSIRSMSPDCIICDELTGEDVNSVKDCVNYGVKIIASVHCDNIESLLKNNGIIRLINTGAFGEIIFLSKDKKCKVTDVINTEELKLD